MNGLLVRATGISLCSVPSPSGDSAMYLRPSAVLIRISARVSRPSLAPLTRIRTSTWSPTSSMPVTLPTLTPATRTSSIFCRPAASVKSAW